MNVCDEGDQTASWILHQDKASAHNALSVKRYLAKNNIPIMVDHHYDFFHFPKVKSALRRTRFESIYTVKANG